MSINITDKPEVNVVNVGDEISQTNLDAINAASGASTANPFVTVTTTQEGTGIYTTIEAGSITVASPAMGSSVVVGSSQITTGGTTLDHLGGITCSSITFPDQTVLTTAGGGGGGGSYLPLSGGTMTGDIIFGTAGQYIGEGNFDTSLGGVNGLSLVCSVGYEFNWQAGWLTTTEQNSSTGRALHLNGSAGTTLKVGNPADEYDGTTIGLNSINIIGVGSLGPVWVNTSFVGGVPTIEMQADGATSTTKYAADGITFPDGTTQVTATVGTGDQTLATTDSVRFATVNVGVSGSGYETNYSNDGVYFSDSGNVVASIFPNGASFYSSPDGGMSMNTATFSTTGIVFNGSAFTGITFPDLTTQTTAYTGPTNPFDQSLNTTDNPTFIGVRSEQSGSNDAIYVTNTNLTVLEFGGMGIPIRASLSKSGLTLSNAGAGITFPDGTIQTTAAVGGSPTVVNLVGMTGMYNAVLGDRIFIFDSGSIINVTALYAEPAGTELTFINQDATGATYVTSASSGFYEAGSGSSSTSLNAKVTKKAILGTDTYFYVI